MANKDKNIKPSSDTYFSSLPSHKAKVQFFTTMGDRVIVETLSNGAIKTDGPEQKERMEYLKKRFPPYIFSSDEIKTDPTKANALSEKIRQIRRDVKDKKLADEIINTLTQ